MSRQPARRAGTPILDPDTLDRLRRVAPAAYAEVKAAVYGTGGASEDFLAAFEELFSAGVLTWEEIERFEGEM